MEYNLLFWIYMANAVLVICHEIDSAYWREWELFGLPGGMAGFLLLHIPLVFLILYGLILVHDRDPLGLWIALLLSAGGFFGFSAHIYFMKKGRVEFRTPVSLAILVSAFLASIAQAVVVLHLLAK